MSTPDLRRLLDDRLGTTTIVWYDSSHDSREHGVLAWARWSPVTEPVSYSSETATALWLRPVPAEEFAPARAAMLERVLPEFVHWQDDAMARDDAWQELRHSLTWSLVGDEVRRTDHDQSARHHRRA